ncbi:C-type lectin domain-containing protein [Meloidogyne graminicola]|uniref:C-type lectin domain-containing protein n=1 Tax=Meloidogyne graminicola TaxID=189291 RepID=A0A8S9ZRD1_9BILA|nr:C-type lectin domain-containing protein [Meloidogyne graminicola]
MKFSSLPLFIFISILLFKKFNSSFAQTSNTCLKFECNDDWATRTDSDGKVYGYKAFVQESINFYEANALCRDQCAEVVSIHSAEENEFVRTVAKPLLDDCQNEIICKSRPNETSEDFNRILHSFFIGMHRVQHSRLERCTRDENAYCIWSDMTECDFGNYTGVIGPHETSPPWATGNPNGIVYPLYAIEDCVEFYDSTNGYWNDIPCNFRLSGVICKRDCASYCVDQDTQLMF